MVTRLPESSLLQLIMSSAILPSCHDLYARGENNLLLGQRFGLETCCVGSGWHYLKRVGLGSL